MKKLLLASLLTLNVFSLQTIAQKQFTPTDEIKISGRIKSEITIKTSDLKIFPQQKIKDVKILNYRSEDKGTLKKNSWHSASRTAQKSRI